MYAVTSINILCIAFAFAAKGFPPSNTFAAKLCLVMSTSLLCDFNRDCRYEFTQSSARARAFTHGRRARRAACALAYLPAASSAAPGHAFRVPRMSQIPCAKRRDDDARRVWLLICDTGNWRAAKRQSRFATFGPSLLARWPPTAASWPSAAVGRRVIVAPVPDWLLTIPGLYIGSLNSTATD